MAVRVAVGPKDAIRRLVLLTIPAKVLTEASDEGIHCPSVFLKRRYYGTRFIDLYGRI